MSKTLRRILPVATLLLAGCSTPIGGYTAVASISKDGFARSGEAIRRLEGQEVNLWCYVDHSNLYGGGGAKQILGE